MAMARRGRRVFYMKPGVVGPVLFPDLGKSGKGGQVRDSSPSRANGENDDTAMCGALVAYTSYRLHYGPNQTTRS
jgi:hypothetical protein